MNPEVKTPLHVIETARKLRVAMTYTESLLWDKLKNKKLNGHRFRKQHPVYRYIFDFYCPKARLAIEIDGAVHKERKEYDEYRDELMKSLDIETLRVKDTEIKNDINDVLMKIIEKLNERSALASPQTPRRGSKPPKSPRGGL